MKEELDYSRGAKPLYAQLHDILLEKLRTGAYKKNDVLPTEAEFEELFGVSRITARRALAELAAKGLVKRQAESALWLSAPQRNRASKPVSGWLMASSSTLFRDII
ncbi:GntR family transcriptional regulator [Klebsiella oxytoca]|uniref:GntR family transcriptional regulator n=1 Tax=Klebsiella oxytoca TaxID=571 RepID=UPI003D02FF25